MDTNPQKTNGGPVAAAGWRHAPGDPDGTVRYWDGATWWGEPTERFDRESGRGRLVVDDSRTGTPDVATLPQRGVATVIDAVIAGGFAYGATTLGVFPEPTDPTVFSPNQYLDMLSAFSAWVLFASLIWVVLDVVATATSGRSLGKRVVGINTVNTGTRTPPRRGAALRRALIKCCAMPVVAGVAYSSVLLLSTQHRPAIFAGALVVATFAAVPFASVRRRAPWDVAAGTEVVDLR